MGVFDFLKKKKEETEEPELAKPASLEPPAFERPGAAAGPEPYGPGITEPALPEEMPSRPSAPRGFARLPSEPSLQPQASQTDTQLILAKLETIKAQLDFLQQKFEQFEQQLKREDVVRWR